jgi:hypothetical protein
MKRLLALVAGGLGLRALLRRRSRPALSPSPAEDLRAKLAQAKGAEPAVSHAEPAPEPELDAPEEPAAGPGPATVDERRAGVHAKARQAIDELGKTPD